jgi:hypothetical protein
MNFLCVKMIHNVYDMFVIFFTVKILYILYIYGLCHILFSFWLTCGSMECMQESIFLIDDCTYTINKIVLTVPYKCMYFTLHYMSLSIVRDKLIKWITQILLTYYCVIVYVYLSGCFSKYSKPVMCKYYLSYRILWLLLHTNYLGYPEVSK